MQNTKQVTEGYIVNVGTSEIMMLPILSEVFFSVGAQHLQAESRVIIVEDSNLS